jgi:uncharacterized membrane protein
MDKEKLLEYYRQHKGEVIGMTIALIFALGVLFFGFIKFIFIGACVCAGYYLGKKVVEDKNYFTNLIDRILRFFNV